MEGQVLTNDGSPVTNAIVELYFSDDLNSMIDTKKFVCDQSSKSNLRICHVKTDSTGKFSFLNIAYGKYKLKASLELESSTLKFDMKPDFFLVDLTSHKDFLITDAFKLDMVTISSQVISKNNVS